MCFSLQNPKTYWSYSTQPRRQFILIKLFVKLSSSAIKHQSNLYPKKPLPAILKNIVLYCTVNEYRITEIFVNISPPYQFGGIYTIKFSSGGLNMVQHESVDMNPAAYRFIMDRKPRDSPSIESLTGKNNIL